MFCFGDYTHAAVILEREDLYISPSVFKYTVPFEYHNDFGLIVMTAIKVWKPTTLEFSGKLSLSDLFLET